MAGETRWGRGQADWLAGILALGFAAKLGAVLWALDRGFEIGDEGYSLLNLNHPHDAPAVFQYYRLLAPFGDSFDFGVIDARGLRLVVELLASFALVGGVYAWARVRCFERQRGLGLAFTLFCLLGTLLSTASRSFSYNDVTNLCTYAAVGAIFYLASLPPGIAGRRGRTGAALAAGFANGLELGVKFPSAIALAAVALLALVVGFRALAPRERGRVAGLYGIGVLLAIALYVAVNESPAQLVADLSLIPAVARSSGYEPLHLLWIYAKGEGVSGLQVLWLAAVFGGTLALLRRGFGFDRDRASAVALVVGAVALAVGVRLLHPFFLHPSLVFLSALLAFALALLWSLDLRARRGDPGRFQTTALLALLVLLPLLDIVGTNVPISMRLATHVLPLFAALGVLALDLRERAGYRRLHAVLALVLLAATSVLFVQHHLVAPYGLPRDIFAQREPVEGLPGVRVDPATRSFLESVAAGMREAGFQPGDPVLALDYMPGLVFFLGGTSPGFTLYFFDRPELNCLNVNRLYRAPPYLILGRPMSAEQAACLEAFRFPADFREVRSVRFPYEAVYESFDAADFSHVHLYAPRDREHQQEQER